MAVGQADAEAAVGDDFGEGGGGGEEGGGGGGRGGWGVVGGGGGRGGGGGEIEGPADEVQVRGEAAQEVEGAGVGEVAEAKDLPDLAGGEELLELLRRCVY